MVRIDCHWLIGRTRRVRFVAPAIEHIDRWLGRRRVVSGRWASRWQVTGSSGFAAVEPQW